MRNKQSALQGSSIKNYARAGSILNLQRVHYY